MMALVLPDEIIEEILTRLPTKSLLRFSSVSKQWLRLISDPTFIQSQLKHVLSDHEQQQKLLVTSRVASQFFSVDYESVDFNQRQLKNLPFSAPYGVHVFGSCNGLLCIGIDSEFFLRYDDIIIWNPLLKNYKRLLGSFIDDCDSLLGFGYDSLTDDYKLVIFHIGDKKVEVYSTKSNSWRSFQFESDSYRVDCWCLENVGTFVNGSIYWLAEVQVGIDSVAVQIMVVEFDLNNEEFRFVKLPIRRKPMVKLFVVKGCRLGIFFGSDNYEYFSLLMMKEDKCRNEISWSETEIRIGDSTIGIPICLKTNNEIVIKLCGSFQDGSVTTSSKSPKVVHFRYPKDDLLICNPLDGTIKKGRIQVPVQWAKYTVYIETLVSLS